MNNYNVFEKECQQALDTNEINKRDFLLLTKIAKAIYEEDKDIAMSLTAYDSGNSHKIKCKCNFIDNWEEKIKMAMKKAYIYHQNVWLGWGECSIIVTSDTWSKSVSKIVNAHIEKNMNKSIAERRKKTSQFGELIEWIVKLAEKGKYEKCDGIIEDLIRNYDTKQLISEEEMLKDLQTVIDGTFDDEKNDCYVYNDDVYAIAEKYNTTEHNIKGVLQMKIRCFDRNYLYRDGFFDLTTEDFEIIKRKLKGESFDDVEPFKLLSEIEL